MSEWTCDKCGQPIVPGQPTYGLAVNHERQTSRHWSCHVPFEDLMRELRRDTERTQDELDKLARGSLRK